MSLLRQIVFYLIIIVPLFVLAHAAQNSVQDPYETYNRHVFALNQTVDAIVLKPIATIYKGVVPDPMRSGVHRAFLNLGEIPTFASSVLQGNGEGAGTSLFRFLINSTVGVFGFFDVASRLGIEKKPPQDVGLVFAKWGDKQSPYLVMPFFGPATVRDAMATPFTIATSIYPYLDSNRLSYSLFAANVIDQRTQLLGSEAVMREAALDPYVFQRNAYLQLRQRQIEANDGMMAADPYESLEQHTSQETS